MIQDWTERGGYTASSGPTPSCLLGELWSPNKPQWMRSGPWSCCIHSPHVLPGSPPGKHLQCCHACQQGPGPGQLPCSPCQYCLSWAIPGPIPAECINFWCILPTMGFSQLQDIFFSFLVLLQVIIPSEQLKLCDCLIFF